MHIAGLPIDGPPGRTGADLVPQPLEPQRLEPEPVRWWVAALRFARRCGDDFIVKDCLIAASALSYTTIVSLLPLAAIVVAIFSGFEMFSTARARFLGLLLENLAPDIGEQATMWFQMVATNAGQTTAIGGVALVVTSVLLLGTIEDRLQWIWDVPAARPWRQRVLAYWMVLTLGPLLIGLGFSLPDYLDAMAQRAGVGTPFHALAEAEWLVPLARGVSFAVEAMAFTLLFRFIPNCVVRWRESATGAVLAAGAIEVVKVFYTLFVTKIASYGTVYGALAGVPIFLLWMYLFWAVVLFGAVVAAQLRPPVDPEDSHDHPG